MAMISPYLLDGLMTSNCSAASYSLSALIRLVSSYLRSFLRLLVPSFDCYCNEARSVSVADTAAASVEVSNEQTNCTHEGYWIRNKCSRNWGWNWELVWLITSSPLSLLTRGAS